MHYALHKSFPSKVSMPAGMTEADIADVEHGNGFPAVKVEA